MSQRRSLAQARRASSTQNSGGTAEPGEIDLGMTNTQFTLFDTPVGRCGIVWGERGIVGLQLPEGSDDKLARARGASGGCRIEPPEMIQAIKLIVALLEGEPSDLSEIALDMERWRFRRKVYAIARRSLRPDAHLRRHRDATRRQAFRARCWTGDGQKPVSDRCSVPPRRRGERQARWFFGERRWGTKLRLLAIESRSDRAAAFQNSRPRRQFL